MKTKIDASNFWYADPLYLQHNPILTDPIKLDECRQRSAEVMSKWWADRIRDGVGIGDNGACDIKNVGSKDGREFHLPSAIGMFMTQKIREEHPIDEAVVQKFQDIFCARIVEKLRNPENKYPRLDIEGWCVGGPQVEADVDYHAWGLLLDSAVDAGIEKGLASSFIFPLKTRMMCSARSVVVRAGYAAGPQELLCQWGVTLPERQAWWKLKHVEDDAIRTLVEAEWTAEFGEHWTYDMIHKKYGANAYDRIVRWDWQGPIQQIDEDSHGQCEDCQDDPPGSCDKINWRV